MDGKNSPISLRRQADLLSINRSSYYYGPPKTESEENLKIMRFMDEAYMEHSWTLWPSVAISVGCVTAR